MDFYTILAGISAGVVLISFVVYFLTRSSGEVVPVAKSAEEAASKKEDKKSKEKKDKSNKKSVKKSNKEEQAKAGENKSPKNGTAKNEQDKQVKKSFGVAGGMCPFLLFMCLFIAKQPLLKLTPFTLLSSRRTRESNQTEASGKKQQQVER